MPLINVAAAATATATIEKSNFSHILNTTKQQTLPYHINNEIELNARLGAKKKKKKKKLAFCCVTS